jgi:hypothetical protein
MQKKYLYISIAIAILLITLITLQYLTKPHYKKIDASEKENIKAIDSSKILMKQYVDSVTSLNDSVNYYKMRIEANNLKLKKLQARKNEAPQIYVVDDWFTNDYTKYLTDRYK